MKSAPGPTEIPNWQKQIIKTNTTVSNNAAVNTGTASPIAVELYNMPKEQRRQIAIALKSAGYRVPTNGVFSNSLLNAYNDALQTAQLQATQLGQQFSSQFFSNYLTNEATARGSVGAGKDGTYTTEVESVITKANAEDIINKVFKDQLGRAATDEEITRYTGEFKEKAGAKPTVTTTITSGKKTKVKTQPGFTTGRAEQYLVDRIAGTDEAKANQVLSYYESAMKVLAGE
jgi:hypothetical protein